MGGIQHIKLKTCRVCKEKKSLEDFYKLKKWHASYCKICQNEFAKMWRRENADYMKEYKKKAFQEMPKEKKWDRHLKQRYGITNQQYLDILSKQKGVCKICKGESIRMRLSVDHDHKTGKVRGLLCERCNTLLGRVKEMPEILENAALYLRAAK